MTSEYATMTEAYERETERHMLAAVLGGYSICIDNGDGVCEVCRVELAECPECRGTGYHRYGCKDAE